MLPRERTTKPECLPVLCRCGGVSRRLGLGCDRPASWAIDGGEEENRAPAWNRENWRGGWSFVGVWLSPRMERFPLWRRSEPETHPPLHCSGATQLRMRGEDRPMREAGHGLTFFVFGEGVPA